MSPRQKKTFKLTSFLGNREPRAVISLLTDFGTRDGYVGVMKGVIAGLNPSALVIDVTHDIPPQDVFAGAYVLVSSYKYFPQGAIHVVVVDPGVGTQRKILAVQTSRYIFLAPDNGVLDLVLKEEKPTMIVEVKNRDFFLNEVSATFHGRDIFAPVAARLAMGVSLEELGPVRKRIEGLHVPLPIRRPDGGVAGEVLYIDRFGNLITNIERKVLERSCKTPLEQRSVHVGRRRVRGISESYAQKEPGELLALFSSTGHLEIAVNQGSAQALLKARRGTRVEVLPNA